MIFVGDIFHLIVFPSGIRIHSMRSSSTDPITNGWSLLHAFAQRPQTSLKENAIRFSARGSKSGRPMPKKPLTLQASRHMA